VVKRWLSAKWQNYRFAVFAQNYAVSVSEIVRNHAAFAFALSIALWDYGRIDLEADFLETWRN
jgi:hypothetical protein